MVPACLGCETGRCGDVPSPSAPEGLSRSSAPFTFRCRHHLESGSVMGTVLPRCRRHGSLPEWKRVFTVLPASSPNDTTHEMEMT
jgi:hypothetical protein